MPLPQEPCCWEEGYNCSHMLCVPWLGHCGGNIVWFDGDEGLSVLSFLKMGKKSHDSECWPDLKGFPIHTRGLSSMEL